MANSLLENILQCSLYENILNVKNLIFTKIFHFNARLIRYPCYIRNGKNINFGKGFTCGYNCRFESQGEDGICGIISFGNEARIGDYVHIASSSKVEIGDNVLMASKIFISDTSHGKYDDSLEIDIPNSNPSLRKLYAKPVKIGNNVWIGEGVSILSGVTIGDGVIIGANSVVTKDIEEGTIVAGIPAVPIKKYDKVEKVWRKISK